MAAIAAIRVAVDNSRITSIPNQQTGLDNIIAAGPNDHVLSSEITEAASAKADTVSQVAVDAIWEANIDLATPDLSTGLLDGVTGRQLDLTTRQAQVTARDAELNVTLATRVTPLNLYDSRFAWISNRTRLTNGSIVLIKQAANAVIQVNSQIVDNVAEIDRINGILFQKQHSTDAFLAL